MKYVDIIGTDISASNLVLGTMRIAEKTDAEIRGLATAAFEQGVNFVDLADAYGAELHECEERFAQSVSLSPSKRDGLTLQTKVGIVRDGPYYDFSYERLVSSAEGSLRALNTDRLDVLLLHRPDALVEPDEVARAFDELEAAGKVRYFGVSNHTPRQIDLLRKSVSKPLVINQLQLSITHSPIIAQGTAMNMFGYDQSVTSDGGGVLDYCRLHDITVQAWSPFQAGFFDGVFLGNPDHRELNEVLDRLASKYGISALAIAVAWITRHPANMQVVLGTTSPERVTAAAEGSDVPLTRSEWYELFRASGHIVP